MVYWANTHAGGRVTFGYNDSGTAAAWRVGWSVKWNVWSALGLKTDTFGTPNGNRVGNWETIWNVNWEHNMRGEVYAHGANDFPPEFAGMRSFSQTVAGGVLPPWYEFEDDQSSWGTRQYAPTGGGYYAPKIGSPIRQIATTRTQPGELVLPFDSIGRPANVAGAYASQPTAVIGPIGSTILGPIGTTTLTQ